MRRAVDTPGGMGRDDGAGAEGNWGRGMKYQLFDPLSPDDFAAFFRGNNLVRNPDHASHIRQQCSAHDLIAFIDFNPDVNGNPYGVWHTYALPGLRDCVTHPGWDQYVQLLGWRQPQELKPLTELDIEEQLVKALQRLGTRCDRQVHLRSGIADVVTAQSVYEVKLVLDRAEVFKAIGQVLVYAEELSKPNRFIVGTRGDSQAIQQLLPALGIKLIMFDQNTGTFDAL